MPRTGGEKPREIRSLSPLPCRQLTTTRFQVLCSLQQPPGGPVDAQALCSALGTEGTEGEELMQGQRTG